MSSTGSDDQPVPVDRASPRTPSPAQRVPSWITTVSTVSWSFIGAVLALTLLVVAIAAVREVVIPIVLSAFLAVVSSPAVDWLARRGVPRPLGALVVLVVIGLVVVVSIGIVVLGVIEQRDNLEQRFADVVTQLEDLLERNELTDAVETILEGAQSSGSVLRDGLGSTIGSVAGTAAGFASGTIVGAVVLYYLLKDGPDLLNSFVRGRRSGARIGRILDEAARTIRSYVKGRTILALVQGIAIGGVAAVAGVPLAVAIGVVNVLGAYIPYIGGFIGGAFAVLMALSVGGLGLAGVMLIAAVAISVGLENLLEPALLGNRLALHPIVVLFATVVGGLLVGIVGMFLAAPVVAIARMLLNELVDAGFFASDG